MSAIETWVFVLTECDCTKPSLSSNSYTLTNDKATYAVNETYDIFCTPGYKASGSGTLVCGSQKAWSLEPPTCSPAEGTYPWWMLLVAMTVVILLVACILPRLLQCFCSKATKKKNTESDEEQADGLNDGYDDDSDDGRSSFPVPDWSKAKKMTNIEFMAKLHKDADKKTLKRATKNAVF
ncbi:membrane cofactor protein-like [Dreissena polymorpha]|uniref:membrane cofactor protein-like n=1 Tax=Dreissena polymorpha TaxID=45954 RepID=UPI002263E9DC|nr:membrane cofactor protein-like [Dreissena polymorpha]